MPHPSRNATHVNAEQHATCNSRPLDVHGHGVAAAQAQAIVANKLAERNKILLEQGFVSQIEYERSVADSIAQRESIKAKQAQCKSPKSYTVRDMTPFDDDQ